MTVTIHTSGGTGIAEYTLKNGTTKEEYVGEVSDRWLAKGAEKHFAELLGEEVTIEVIDMNKT